MNKNHAPRSVWKDPVHFIAFGFGSGCMPWAPGTFGSLMAIPFYFLLKALPAPLYAMSWLVFFFIGCWVSDVTGREVGEVDHSGIVIDEMLGMWLVLWGIPQSWLWIGCAFALFRFFDIVKPMPIRWLEQRFNNGFGVMIDDVAAALYAFIAWRLLFYFI